MMVLMTTVALIMMVVLMMTWITKVAAWLCEERRDVGHEQRHWGRGLGIRHQYFLRQNCHHNHIHNHNSSGYEDGRFRFCRITEILESQGVNTSRNLFTRTVTQEPALRPSNEHERCPKRRASEMKHMLIYSIIYLMYILDIPSLTRFTLCFCNTPLCNTVPRHMGGKASTLEIQSILTLLTVLFLVLSWQIQILYTCLNHDPIDISNSKVGVPSAVHDHWYKSAGIQNLGSTYKIFHNSRRFICNGFWAYHKNTRQAAFFSARYINFSAAICKLNCFMFQYFNIQFEPYQKRSYHTNLDCLPWLEILLLSWNMCEDNAHMLSQIGDTPR